MNDPLKNKRFIRASLIGVVLLLLLSLGYQYFTESGWFNNSTRLYLITKDATGITTKSPITINGLEVGRVKDLHLDNKDVIIELLINNDFKIGKSAKFYSVQKGIWVERAIQIADPTAGKEFYENADTIIGELNIKEKSIIDSSVVEKIEPTLKELSRTVGKALLEYGESPHTDSIEERKN